MKLWLKISIICAAVLLLIISICSAMLMLTAKNKLLSLTVQGAEARQTNLQESYRSMVALYGRDDLGPVEKRSLLQYCFHSFADINSVLVCDGDTVYSNIGFNPAALLPLEETEKQTYSTKRIDGIDYLIVGSRFTMLSQQHSVFLVQDTSDVYQSIAQLVVQFCAISAGCITAGIIIVILLMRYATRPLKLLNGTVNRVTHGEYAVRASVTSRDEIGELATNFNTMAEAVQAHIAELQDVAERQRLFIGGLTHEFKTPLTSVIGHAETLLYTDMPRPIVESSLIHIHEQCKWLERLTQKMLRLITLGEELDLREESVEELLNDVKQSMGDTLMKRGTPLEIDCDNTTIRMDRDLIQSLLVNLVDNASKASRSSQQIRIHARKNMIAVSDEGRGIPPEELPRVMDPFYMVDKSRSKKLGGVGLGLALVKRIADAHGAQISIESAPGRGTTVSVIFHDNNTFTYQ